MPFDPTLTTPAVLAELGMRLERHRLERNLTQAELADEAGIGRATLQRLERGESVQLTSLIGLLRVLDLLDGLEVLVPEPVPSPIERLKTQGQRRQRARGAQERQSSDATWTWGEEHSGLPPRGDARNRPPHDAPR
jgi:transcriptional regulator with XRE-family HTH domain